MVKKNDNPASQLQGANKLAAEAVVGITHVVESMHSTILSLGGLIGDKEQKTTGGISGFIYSSIRSITQIVGSGIDVLLGQLGSELDHLDSIPGKEAGISMLNGVLGDHLVSRNNPLAITMQFRRNGKALTDQDIENIISQSSGRLYIAIHGLCMNDMQWTREGHDHAEKLGFSQGFSPIYLHYNSGLHISDNGINLSLLLQQLVSQHPQIQKINILAHSMGGLVARSACYSATQETDAAWLDKLEHIVFLGTPHNGALLAKGGNLVDFMLNISPFSVPFSSLVRIRSCGITDLQSGLILESDWKGKDRFKLELEPPSLTPLPAKVACYAIAVSTDDEQGLLSDHVVGDGLVTVGSALGRRKGDNPHLDFPTKQQWVGRGINHMELLNHPDVYQRIESWFIQCTPDNHAEKSE